jgi:hypothetical protein
MGASAWQSSTTPCYIRRSRVRRCGGALIENCDSYCKDKITNVPVLLTDELKALIDGYDFANVEHLTAPLIVKDPAARPALVKVLELIPEEVPPGVTPASIQPEELEYVDQFAGCTARRRNRNSDGGRDSAACRARPAFSGSTHPLLRRRVFPTFPLRQHASRSAGDFPSGCLPWSHRSPSPESSQPS